MPPTKERVDWLEPAARQFPPGLPRSTRNTIRVMFRLLRDAFEANPQCAVQFVAEVLRLLRIRLHAVQAAERHRLVRELQAENEDLQRRAAAAEAALARDTALAEHIQRLIGPHGPHQDST